MAAARPVRDSDLLDAIEALPHDGFSGTAWRVVREGRDPTACARSGGRWDDGTFDVLYTSLAADGAIGEMYFHASRGQPVMPSRVRYHLHELRVKIESCVRLVPIEVLASLGYNIGAFGQMAYAEREQEYPRTQDIAEAAHFHGRQGLLVPSARSEHCNLILLCEQAVPEAVQRVRDHGPIDWDAWRKNPLGY